MRQSSRRLRVSLAAALLSILMAASSGGAGPETGKSGARPALDCPPCDDGNACTSDTCDPSTGTCGHAPIVCDDANLCTTDTCDPAIGCVFDPLSAGTPCDDGKACTANDVCDDGARCAGTPEPAGKVCDDRNPCTLSDGCDGAGACAGIPETPGSPCDDGQACTTGDVCVQDPSGGIACQGASRVCDDSNLCTNDACDPATGNCVFRPINCDDGKACTQDSCSNGFCQHFVLDPPCDDGNACTIGDRFGCGPNGQMVCFGGATRICDPGDHCFSASCDPASGCVFTYRCDDHNPCTYDSCYVVCNHLPLSGPCDDGDPCTIQDQCDGTGHCRGVSRCDDGNLCTDDRCDPASPDGCSHAFNTASCSDRNACTLGDTCRDGACQPGTILRNCDDGNACTTDTCDPASGECRHTDTPCDDSNPCTIDNCDPRSGGCNHFPYDGAVCDDGNPCTSGDVCRSAACTGTPLNCDDGDPCTIDSCDQASGACTHVLDPGDPDADQYPSCRDNCPLVFNPDQADADADGVGDACDNCPTIPNVDQNPCVCGECIPLDITVTFDSPAGKGSGLVTWFTPIEHDVQGYNVVVYDQKGNRIQQNTVLIPCEECITDQGHLYAFVIPKHKSGHNIFIEQVRLNGIVQLAGPAVRH